MMYNEEGKLITPEEYVKASGEVLKNFRKSRGMTQRQLGEKSSVNEKHISTMENGRKSPNITTLKPVLDALGYSLAEYEEAVYGGDSKQFDADFNEIWMAGFNGNFELKTALFEKLKTQPYCNMQKSTVRQAVKLIEAALAGSRDGNRQKSLELACEALAMTTKGVVSEDCSINMKKLAKSQLTLIEYRTLFRITAMKIVLDQTDDALIIAREGLKLLNHANYDIRKAMQIGMHNNYAKLLYDTGSFKKCLEISNAGLDLCISLGDYRNEASLLRWKGFATLETCDSAEAIEVFQTALDLSLKRKEFSLADELKAVLNDKFDIKCE